MKFEIYGHTEETLDFTKKHKRKGVFLGTYNGVKFHPGEYKGNQLEEWDYLHIFVEGELRIYRPKRFNANIMKSLEKDYKRIFGDCVQMSLF